MPIWIYYIPTWLLAPTMVLTLAGASLFGLFVVRRYVLPRLHFHDGVNDAVSGTVQAIGVFYGITVGLIAVGVWNSYSTVADLGPQESAQIAALYRDVSSYPEPARGVLQAELRDYTTAIVQKAWPGYQHGIVVDADRNALDGFQATLTAFEPATEGQKLLHAEALHGFNQLIEYRRLRLDAVGGGLSGVMWFVIWFGAVVTIAVGYFFSIEDPKLHGILIGLTAAFLGIVLFLIVVNDRPFVGDTGIRPDAYQALLDTLINVPK